MTEAEKLLIGELKKLDIIVPLQEDLIELDNGVILIACGDCDRLPSLEQWIKRLFRKRGLEPRIHRIYLNGGGALIPSESRVARCNEGATIIHHVQQASRLRNIYIVLDATHFECGAAKEVGVNLRALLKYKILGKRRLKRGARDIKKVYSLLHLHYQDSRDRTYIVHTKELGAYLRRTAPPPEEAKRRRRHAA
ncbi:MAG: hypothetical protein AAB372_03290 [Patescibacteria group bacterium]|mgnify:CR=1 FL=1